MRRQQRPTTAVGGHVAVHSLVGGTAAARVDLVLATGSFGVVGEDFVAALERLGIRQGARLEPLQSCIFFVHPAHATVSASATSRAGLAPEQRTYFF